MPQLTAIVGGSVGSNPYAANTWSGSAARLFRAMETAGLLAARAHGIDLARPLKAWLMAKNFRADRAIWRKHFFFDPAYRAALTDAARAIPVTTPLTLQLGSMYSLAEAHPEAAAISYNDGNLAELQASGFGLRGVSPRRIDQALAYEARVSREMRLVFTMSEYLRRSFVDRYGVAPDRVVNVGGAFNLAEIPAAQPEKAYREPRLLFVGAEFARKGGPVLLEAFRKVRERLPAAELHIAGPRDPPSRAEGVVFHGFLNQSDPEQRALLVGLYHQASVFVLPSLYEPFGIAPLEAMLHQLPCVVTRGWALAETVVDGVTGLLAEKENADDLAAKLIDLLAEPDRMAAMGAAGRERALRDYRWDVVVERMQAAVASL